MIVSAGLELTLDILEAMQSEHSHHIIVNSAVSFSAIPLYNFTDLITVTSLPFNEIKYDVRHTGQRMVFCVSGCSTCMGILMVPGVVVIQTLISKEKGGYFIPSTRFACFLPKC